MKKIIISLLCLIHSCCFAFSSPQTLISNSKQMIVVFTPNWESIRGQIQRFERASTQDAWKTIGSSIPVVIGKRGMGLDFHLQNLKITSLIKKEGDNLTPAGVYSIGPIFGFNETNPNKTDYFPLTDTSVCVDDPKSAYYNQLIDSAKISQKDWNSGEQMRQVPQYKFGAVVDYNSNPITPSAGSCIFLHIWKDPSLGTAGCVAMAEPHLEEVLNWLNNQKNPVIVILPAQVYNHMKSDWKLP